MSGGPSGRLPEERRTLNLKSRTYARLNKWAGSQGVAVAEAVDLLLDQAGAPIESIAQCPVKVRGQRCSLVEAHRGACTPVRPLAGERST